MPLPTLFDSFLMTDDLAKNPPQDAWYLWLVLTGSYQMFMAFVNSAALALMVLLLAGMDDVDGGWALIAGLLVFRVTLTIYNSYSRLVIDRFIGGLDVRVDMSGIMGAWASRQ